MSEMPLPRQYDQEFCVKFRKDMIFLSYLMYLFVLILLCMR